MHWQTFSGAFLLLGVVTAVGFPLILLICRLLGVNEVDQYCRKVYLAVPRVALATRG